jgi:hypothetical protein
MRRGVWPLLLWAAPLAAQSPAERVDAVRDGAVVFHFAARPEACSGDEDGYQTSRNTILYNIRGSYERAVCAFGPVYVRIERSGGETIALHFRIASAPRGSDNAKDFGEIPAATAARYLITSARGLGPRNAERALGAASAADAATGTDFLALARVTDAPMDLRKNALFWAGQVDVPIAQLTGIDSELRDRDLRRHYTFVLSQRSERAATDKLIDIVQHDDDREVKRQALFWLGQSRDPKAREFLRDLILK